MENGNDDEISDKHEKDKVNTCSWVLQQKVKYQIHITLDPKQ